ncbi:MAG: DUF971 domain-containing protein [Planctomycetaceae bacterium]|nr:DUF971 domain-containing protein [Planctomycetaceae bacterium]
MDAADLKADRQPLEGAFDLTPRTLKGDASALSIEWSDGRVDRLRWADLRKQCPCATCRVRRAEPPPLFNILKPEEAAPLRATGMLPIGNYAYQIDFSDGHKTGIYSLELLRHLGQA